MAIDCPTLHGGVKHGLAALSHSELQAAQHALSKLTSATGSLGRGLSNISQSATSTGGSFRPSALQTPGLLQGTGTDTFVGGARSSSLQNVGADRIVGGSAKSVDTALGLLGTHNPNGVAFGTDSINIAGATALSVTAREPETNTRAHTVTLGDKTTITISGLSAHDISKLSH